VFIEEATDQAGLSGYHLGVTLFTIGALIGLLFAFLFLAIGAWNNESNFATVARSMIMAFMGSSVGFLRPKNAIENGDPKSTKEQVGTFFHGS